MFIRQIIDIVGNSKKSFSLTPFWSVISTLLHLGGLRPRVYYTFTNFRGGGARSPCPPLNTPMGMTDEERPDSFPAHFRYLECLKHDQRIA